MIRRLLLSLVFLAFAGPVLAAPTVTGTAEAVTLTANSATLTIPADATAVYVGWSYYNATGAKGLATATLNSVAASQTSTLQTAATDLVAAGVLAWYAPATGARTLTMTFDAATTEGPNIIAVYVKGGELSAYRDVKSAHGNSSAALSVSLTTVSGDLVIKWDQRNDAAATPPATSAGWTSVASQNLNSEHMNAETIPATGSSLTVVSEDENYSTLFTISIPDGDTSTKEQEGFRFGVDDAAEASHTWAAAQDTSVTLAASQARLIRMLVNGTGDAPAIAYTLRYQKNGAGGYTAVPIAAASTPTLSFGVQGTIAYSAASGTTVSPTYPTGITTTSALVLIVGQKPTTANGGTVTTPSGWTLQASRTGANDGNTGGYVATLGADTGNTNIFVYTKDTVAGTETGTLAITVGDNNVAWADIYRVQASAEATFSYAADTGKDTTTGATVSIATAGGLTIAAGDILIAGMVVPTDVTTPAQFSAESLTQSGTTFGTVTEVEEPDSTAGNDIGGFVVQSDVASGSGSAAVTLGGTAGGTTTNVMGPGFVIRIRAVAVSHEVYISPSANITAGGEATTFQLAAPSGKATSDFVTGRRWDDENGTDTIDLTTDDYTEVEWSVGLSATPITTDYYDFRVYQGALALDTYSVTPRWTVGTSASSVPIFIHHLTNQTVH